MSVDRAEEGAPPRAERAEGGSPPWAGAPFMIYGAYGFTGRLLVEEALARGHRPVLAGRDRARLEPLAAASGLEFRVFGLAGAAHRDEAESGQEAWDRQHRRGPGRAAGGGRGRAGRAGTPRGAAVPRGALDGVRGVLHAAGPFVRTSAPMVRACLEAGVHYLDITGEVPVFESIFRLDREARARAVVLLPGVGMDVVPTDALAGLLNARLTGAVRLELALHSPGPASAGTLKTVLENLPAGLKVRRGGELRGAWPGSPEFRRRVDFGAGVGDRAVAPYTWGDLSTAWRTTGIGDVTCYLTTRPTVTRLLPWLLPPLRRALALGALRRVLQAAVGRTATGPDEAMRRGGRTRVWGRVEDAGGRSEEMVVETLEAYQFTAVAGVRAMEEVLYRTGSSPGTSEDRAPRARGEPRVVQPEPLAGAQPLAGALTPSLAFGPDWVLGLPGSRVVEGGAEPPGQGSNRL